MAFAINIRSDCENAQRIYKLWDDAAKLEAKPSMRSMGYPPHFTFGIYQKIDMGSLEAAANALSKNTSVLAVQFERIDFFDTSPLVLWLRATNETPLLKLRNLVNQYISDDLCHEHYKLDAWQPHCTLAFQIPDENRETALEFASQKFDPFKVNFNVIDWVEFPPVEIFGEINLSN